MYLKQSKYKNGRVFLSICESYRDKVQKKSKSRTVLKIGYKDVLDSKYEDPIAHYTEVAKKMTEDKNNENKPLTLSLNKNEVLEIGTSNSYNLGYLPYSSVYHSLELDKLFKKLQRRHDFEYDSNAIAKLLIYSRAICPGSKKNAFENKELFFDRFNFSLKDIYNCLTFFNKYTDEIQHWLNQKMKEKYNRKDGLVYYDVTNYYFEIDETDDLRKKGYSKEHRPDPIVQMGLFMDQQGFPISYKLFPGNTVDSKTLIPALETVQTQFKLGTITVVGDRGMITGDNIREVVRAKNNYVFSYSIRKADAKFQKYVLEQEGYTSLGDDGFKLKSRLEPRKIRISVTKDDKKKIVEKFIDEKHVIFYSPKYAKKAQMERNKIIEKAQKLIKNPGLYTKATSYGAAEYVKNIDYNLDTGEIISKKGTVLEFDEAKLQEKEALDGYYAIVSNITDKEDTEIIDIYRGLWKIEESFKVIKSGLEARPIYLSRADRINSHFLICFITLLIGRIIEAQINKKYPLEGILESLRKHQCTHIQENVYTLSYYDDVLKEISEKYEIKMNQKYMTLSEIKKILASTKI